MSKITASILSSLLFTTACTSSPEPGKGSGSDMGSGSDTGPSVADVLASGGDFADPPPEHGESPVGAPGETTLSYTDGTQWSCATQHVSIQQDPEKFVTL